ncbi:galactose-specific lectin nattectin-like isoform X1 [Hippocampus comes]|uniref:galactose-specific lectin nattectin-like isoform X1 n=1 Tax=Hippocampus comes TaxID=109280 RepID=UPI00094F3099|nr:PREDICTED: galactose-specific lectin nattectin-like isoform X1 [Hippocampus comes]
MYKKCAGGQFWHSSIHAAKMARLHLLVVLCVTVALSQARHSHPEKNQCPKGWTQLDKYCYSFKNDPRTFPDAESVCNILGGNLVSINSAKEHALVVELIREGAGSVVDTWIGLHDAILEGDFVWTDGEVVNFKNFGANQPDNNGGNENCVEIEADDSLWDDDECTDLNPFVCIRPVDDKDCH